MSDAAMLIRTQATNNTNPCRACSCTKGDFFLNKEIRKKILTYDSAPSNRSSIGMDVSAFGRISLMISDVVFCSGMVRSPSISKWILLYFVTTIKEAQAFRRSFAADIF